MLIVLRRPQVYGSAHEGQNFKEGAPHKPSNPYSASKSAAEMICHSYYNTYNGEPRR